MALLITYSEDVVCSEGMVDSITAEVKVCGSEIAYTKEIPLVMSCQEVLTSLLNDNDLQGDLQRHEAPFQLVLHDELHGPMIPDICKTLLSPFCRFDIVCIEIRPNGRTCSCSFVKAHMDEFKRVKLRDPTNPQSM